jgi:hypothetical protein
MFAKADCNVASPPQFCLVDQLIKGGAHPKEDGPSVTVTVPRKHSDSSDHEDQLQDEDHQSSHSHLRPSEDVDRHLLAHPSSPSSSARAPLLTSVSRRASPFSSPKNQSLVLSVVLAILLMLPGVVMASSGDRLPAYQACVDTCVLDRCKTDPPARLGFALETLRWTCPGDCAYGCTHSITDQLQFTHATTTTHPTTPRMHQFHGKWPFWRLAGIQEPASVLFSLANGWVHYQGWRKVRRSRVKGGIGMGVVGLKRWIEVLAVVQMNTWVWSAVFHTRGECEVVGDGVGDDGGEVQLTLEIRLGPPWDRHAIYGKDGLLFSDGHDHDHVVLHLDPDVPSVPSTTSTTTRSSGNVPAHLPLHLGVRHAYWLSLVHPSVRLWLERAFQLDHGLNPSPLVDLVLPELLLPTPLALLSHPYPLPPLGPTPHPS